MSAAIFLSEISEFRSHNVDSFTSDLKPTEEMQAYVSLAVRNHNDGSLKFAFSLAAKSLGISPRRVKAILFGEVHRVWADELDDARRWYATIYRHQLECAEREGDEVRRRCSAIRSRLTK